MKKRIASLTAVLLTLSMIGSASAYSCTQGAADTGNQTQVPAGSYAIYGMWKPACLPGSGNQAADFIKGVLEGADRTACPANSENYTYPSENCPTPTNGSDCPASSERAAVSASTAEETAATSADTTAEKEAVNPAATEERSASEAAAPVADTVEDEATCTDTSCAAGNMSADCETGSCGTAVCDTASCGESTGYLAKICSGLPASLRDLLNALLDQLGIGQTVESGAPAQEETGETEAPAEETTPVPSDPAEAPAQTETPVETPQSTETPAQPAENLSYEEQVVQLVNENRAANGLAPLTLNSKLSDVARLKSQDMHDKGYFSHTSPTYGDPFEMLQAFGISYRAAGENIAMGYPTPEAVVTGWMNSPGHRANILNASFTQIGVGYVADGNYWTQQFIG